jgi:hypothetical protein
MCPVLPLRSCGANARLRGPLAGRNTEVADLRALVTGPVAQAGARQALRMSKPRIKVSGRMRSVHGAEVFCAIRSYLATASRHGIGRPGALTRAAEGKPWMPAQTGLSIEPEPP